VQLGAAPHWTFTPAFVHVTLHAPLPQVTVPLSQALTPEQLTVSIPPPPWIVAFWHELTPLHSTSHDDARVQSMVAPWQLDVASHFTVQARPGGQTMRPAVDDRLEQLGAIRQSMVHGPEAAAPSVQSEQTPIVPSVELHMGG